MSAVVNDGGLIDYTVGLTCTRKAAGCSSPDWTARDAISAGRCFGGLLAGAGSTGLAVLAIFGIAVAVLGASFTGCQPGSEPALASTGPTPSAYALQSIPPERLRLYEQAGSKFDIDWSFLASIGAQECDNGECAGTNSSGCAGPMQIAYVRGSACSPGAGPTLWERYAVSRAPRPRTVRQRSGGRDLHRRADPARRHGRPADRRHLRRIPPGRVPLLRRVRGQRPSATPTR